ncbi:MAG: trypsin-like peptidase domain-containing protein, partial [Verrucomicrobiota bacterium]|nr:trypsin-like peptidase domain-containing protein [Verrucomicrobiota bacterium]
MRNSCLALVAIFVLISRAFGQADPASEPAVLAVAKALPAVVNINTERVVRRQVRDPFEEFAAQYFGNYQSRPREIRQTLQSLGSGSIVDPAGYIVTNEHVVARAADLKIEVTMNDGKTYNAHYITGDPKKDLAFIKIDAKAAFPFISLDNLSPNLLGETVLVVGNALGYGSSISRGVLSGTKRDITIEEIDYKNLVQTDAAINPG